MPAKKRSASPATPGYTPMMSPERARRLRGWHVQSDKELREGLPRRMFYLGLELLIPKDVFAPGGRGYFHPAVRDEVKPTDRVLDVGTGSGIVAILAAARSSDVVAVDINPKAVEAARANAVLNGVADRISFKVSDVFAAVKGDFDLVVFDPPFRWFKARDLLELSHTDENYQALTRFMREVSQRLRPGGRILLNFGTSGDIDYLYRLIEEAHLTKAVLATDELVTDKLSVSYYVFRLTPPQPSPQGGGRKHASPRSRRPPRRAARGSRASSRRPSG